MLQIISLILNALLTSGMVVTLATIRSVRKRAKADAASAEIDNARRLVENFDSYIVKPLKDQVDELKTSVQNLQSAIRQISNCPHREHCPVADMLDRMQNKPEGERKQLPPPADPDEF